MNNQFQQNQNNEKPKRKYWKFVLGFLGIIVLTIGGFFVWDKYFSPSAKYQRETQQNYQKYLNWQANYEKAMREDIYGGKTPQETLQMYIEAVEKGDYELASKYFIGDYQEKELKSFDGATNENIGKVINLLKLSIKNKGGYSWDNKFFSIDKPLYVSFKLYPNGIWKIIEI